ncbi:MAG: hypothetical protein Q4G68_03410 [Planctomycetia bacterium]|nr:hypothetical protein [Planctomycetia bacterium]
MKAKVTFPVLGVILLLLFFSAKLFFIPYYKTCQISKLRNLYIKEDLLPRLHTTCNTLKSEMVERNVDVLRRYVLPIHIKEVAYMYEYANSDMSIPTIPLGAFITENPCDMAGNGIRGLPSQFLILHYMYFDSNVHATGMILSFDGYPEMRRDFSAVAPVNANETNDITEYIPMEALERLVLFYSEEDFNTDEDFPNMKMLLPANFPVEIKQIEKLAPQLRLILSDGEITEPIPIWCEPSEINTTKKTEE